MNINLIPSHEKMVREKVKSGLYTSASEVMRAALRLMAEQDSIRQAKMGLLGQDIRAGMESGTAVVRNLDDIRKAGQAL
jgi:antitoxin ParD1/3/4